MNEATFKVMVDSMATMATMAVALTVVMTAMMAALVAESGRCACDGGVATDGRGLADDEAPPRDGDVVPGAKHRGARAIERAESEGCHVVASEAVHRRVDGTGARDAERDGDAEDGGDVQ